MSNKPMPFLLGTPSTAGSKMSLQNLRFHLLQKGWQGTPCMSKECRLCAVHPSCTSARLIQSCKLGSCDVLVDQQLQGWQRKVHRVQAHTISQTQKLAFTPALSKIFLSFPDLYCCRVSEATQHTTKVKARIVAVGRDFRESEAPIPRGCSFTHWMPGETSKSARPSIMQRRR